ncbi:immunoglobulin-like domain-containing receptor 1a isoform X2 [Megalops cyprinoides]|uniref:immunoglobulin-like domain-containing receptor 1a isoform X2 n=1 Tax=Megalops cyprinoides TaxID=118141 RepID=UPI0018652027|nr:immunoglobulin-like domain-containing receptor 1a isoform X2 [Megalops cyprinoides]
MGNLILTVLLFGLLPAAVLSIQVIVPQTERSTALFASVTIRCDYTTSANLQDVLVTWRYKSFCMDPVLQYYSTAYQAALSLGQDPANDCPDRQRTIRTVVQKRGTNEPILGSDYRERKITIQNKADLVITEVMWWDNGVYFCSVDAPGDTTGDSDREVKLIVYPVMQHRMMKDAQRAMAPWLHGQPVYAPISSHASSTQMNPMLYSEFPSKQNIPMAPMPLPPPHPAHPSMPPSMHGNGSIHGTSQALDYLESQVRNMDVSTPLFQPQAMPPPPQHMPQGVPFSPGPPSMLSSLNEMGVQGVERRVIQLPPIVEHPGSSARRVPSGPRSARPPSRSSESSSRSARRRNDYGPSRQDLSPPRRGILRSYSEESDFEDRRRGSGPGGRPRSRSRDDLLEEMRRAPPRRDRSYSPPRRRGSWSSEDEDSSRRGGARGRGGGWPEKPPSYTSIEIKPGRRQNGGLRHNERFSDKSSRSGTSVVI